MYFLMGNPLELKGKNKQVWEISKSTELSSLLSKSLSKLPPELDAIVSETESGFYHELIKI